MGNSRFAYVTYIRATPEKLWQALTEPEFTRKYWYGCRHDSDWKPGASWRLMFADGRVGDTGEIIEIEPHRRLVISWRNEFRPELKAEGHSRLTCEFEPLGASVKLTVVHELALDGSKLIEAVSDGWPQILSSLKTLLETGEPLVITRESPKPT